MATVKTKQPVKVMQKHPLRALAMPLANASGLRPNLESADYVMFPIHDGSKEAIRVSRDNYYGQAEIRTKHWQWYAIDIALNYDDTDEDAPRGSKVHYMFRVLTPCNMSLEEMKCYVNRVLEDLYDMLGRGLGSVYASIIPAAKVQLNIDQGLVVPFTRKDSQPLDFSEWTLGYTDDLHYVDPETIPTWDKPVQK